MIWKLKSIGEFMFLLAGLFLMTITCSNAQNPYQGIENPKLVNPYWEDYPSETKENLTEEVKNALRLSLSKLNLFEYSLVLEELLQSYNNDHFEREWLQYVDNLKRLVDKDLIETGLIPLQAHFFHATLDANPDFKDKYPEAFSFIKENTPIMKGKGYQPENYKEVLEKYAFSDVVGKGIMLEFLMVEDENLLEIIYGNPSLKDRYLLWLENLTDPANEFNFNQLRPRIMLSRKQLYLVGRLKKSAHPLAETTWQSLDQVKISRLREPAPDSFFRVLNGVWEGPYADKTIRIQLTPRGNDNPEQKIKGFNKFAYQSDIKQIAMKGSFEDKGDYFEVTMEEYRVPFEEEPKWKQEAINSSWGGPEEFYPHPLVTELLN